MYLERGRDAAAASEYYQAARERTYRADASRRPVLVFTGANGAEREFLTAAASGAHLTPILADVGYPLISAQFGSPPYAWGNDLSQTRIGQAWTMVKARLGTKTDKFIGVGVSKGFTALARYARANPANVAALIGLVPAVSPIDIYTNNRSGLAAEIAAAYGGAAGWLAVDQDIDALANAAAHTIPMQLHYASDDPVILPSTVTDFVAACASSEAVALGAVGHSAASVDGDVVLSFLEPYLA